MGTYTTNYNLFMPTIGEQGWGTLVNENFSIIDTTMKGFDDVLSKMTWDGDNVTFPGSVTTSGGLVLSNSLALSYNGWYDTYVHVSVSTSTEYVPIISSPFPLSGVVSIKTSSVNKISVNLHVVTSTGLVTHTLSTTQTEYSISDAYNIYIYVNFNSSAGNTGTTLTIGIPKIG